MSAPALAYNASFDTLLQELAIILGTLRAKPETEKLRPDVEAFAEVLLASQTQDARLLLSVLVGNTLVKTRDDDLDDVTDIVLEAILAETKGSYGAPLYKHFAGDERPSIFKRPILGKQLERIRAWPASMEQTDALRSLKELTEEAVRDADEALAVRNSAQEERTRFRAVGDRKRLIDSFSALRDTLFEKLVALAKERGEQDPQAYARGFFGVRPTQSKIESEARLAQLQEQRTAQQQALTDTETEIAQLSATLEAHRLEEEAREQARVELAAAEQALAEAKKKAAALKARKR